MERACCLAVSPTKVDDLIASLDLEVAIEGWMRISQPHKLQEPTYHRVLESFPQLRRRVVVTVNRSAVTIAHDRRMVIRTGEQAHVVDLRDSGREELDGSGDQILVVVTIQG